jgi:CRISPR/Cas system endoribonuclease Cas6 (RAMP superfamily)
VGAVAADWPALRGALARLRLPPVADRGPLADTVRCSVGWHGGVAGAGFGPSLVADGALDLAGGDCLVEALTPLHLTTTGRMVNGPPPLEVLVRSAGERLRQLCLHWGEGGEALPTVIARAYRESSAARLAWAEMGRAVSVSRRSASTGQTQVIRGILGTFAYEEVSPLALAVLTLGAEAGVGKDTAFGCGQIRVSIAEGW